MRNVPHCERARCATSRASYPRSLQVLLASELAVLDARGHQACICHGCICHAMPCHVPCHAMPCYAMPCHAMSCHALPCHAMPCHAMLCCAMRPPGHGARARAAVEAGPAARRRVGRAGARRPHDGSEAPLESGHEATPAVSHRCIMTLRAVTGPIRLDLVARPCPRPAGVRPIA